MIDLNEAVYKSTDDASELVPGDDAGRIKDEERPLTESDTEFGIKLVNSVKAMNLGEISYHEMVSNFTLADDLKCLYLFLKAAPYSPIAPIYPQEPFFLFKGVKVPGAFDLSESEAVTITTYMESEHPGYFHELRLHDLDKYHIDAYERAIRIYNDMVDKTRSSYHSQVKEARSQIIEISAVIICLSIILVVMVGLF
ncbi:MAG: hypothetical protein EBT51_02635 [Flavobacteriaceae bacterium]|nr:hypothetical protein [Flavobacteriaceae bacterium]